jgi:enolase-phosphatase E1
MLKAIITDIEGTTTSISFVYEVLFPYAREHLPAYINEHGSERTVVNLLRAIEIEVDKPLNQRQAIQKLLEWMDEDKKFTPLKDIQGLIWEDGYSKGSFRGHIYKDVPPNLQRWHDLKISLYVYSSGSIKAQKLLFSHSEYGDLTPYFKDFFDTTTGNKRESESYQRIAMGAGFEPEQIMFLSDVVQELDAAAIAGFKTVLVDRDGSVEPCKFNMVRNFNEIQIN